MQHFKVFATYFPDQRLLYLRAEFSFEEMRICLARWIIVANGNVVFHDSVHSAGYSANRQSRRVYKLKVQ